MSAVATAPPVFALLGGVSSGAAPALPGPWALLPAPPAAGVAFGPTGDATPAVSAEATVWRADLPADQDQAATLLAAAEASQRAAEDGLVEAAGRLDRLLAAPPPPAGARSFGAPSQPAPGPPEAALLATLAELRAGEAAVAFGLGDDLATGWERAFGQFERGAERLRQVIGHAAWVETRVEGRLLGWTVVGWTGDSATAWAAPPDSAAAARHGRIVALALASRAATVRSLALAGRGVVVLSGLLNPATALLALPSVWRFVVDVVGEVSAARGIAQERRQAEEATDGE